MDTESPKIMQFGNVAEGSSPGPGMQHDFVGDGGQSEDAP
jgi:hypothetical protein